jgi:hypothetical protein
MNGILGIWTGLNGKFYRIVEIKQIERWIL